MKRHPFFEDVAAYLNALCGHLVLDYVYWVHGGDESECWCRECCRFKVRNLRRRNKKTRDDYLVDGGWGHGEEDGVATCKGCGKLLAYSLTNSGMEEELDHFLSYGFAHDDGSIDPVTAYELSQILETALYADNDGIEQANCLADRIRQHVSPSLAGLLDGRTHNDLPWRAAS